MSWFWDLIIGALGVRGCQKTPWTCRDNTGGTVGHISYRVGVHNDVWVKD